jgi:hypothetical protein
VVLFKAGDHIPTIPLLDVVGKGLNVEPGQTVLITENVGVIEPIDVTTTVAVELVQGAVAVTV